MGKVTWFMVVFLGIAGVIAGLCYASYAYGLSRGGAAGPTVTALEKMGHLVSLRVHVSDHVFKDWTWGPDTAKVLYLAKGDGLLACDLRGAKILQRDDKKRSAKIQVACPRVLSPRIDAPKCMVVWSSKPWLDWGKYDRLVQAAITEAQSNIEQATGCEENVKAAKANARQLLTNFYEMMGWQIEVVFDDERCDSGHPMSQ